MELSERERAILDFERSWWTDPGLKEARMAQSLELSATRYYALLSELIDRPEALSFDPMTVRRLRRMRDRRRRSRSHTTIPATEEQSR